MSVEASATMNRQVATRVRANLVAVGAVEACRIGGGERREGANYQGAGHRPQLAGAFAALLLQRRGDTASSAHAASHTPGAPAACRAACSPACSTPDRRANLIFLSHFCPQCKVWVVPCGRDGAARKLGEPRCALWGSIQDFGIHAGLAQNVQLLAQDSDCVLHAVHSASAHRWSGPKICGGIQASPRPCKLPEQHGAAVQSNPYDSTQYTQRGQRRASAAASRERTTAESNQQQRAAEQRCEHSPPRWRCSSAPAFRPRARGASVAASSGAPAAPGPTTTSCRAPPGQTVAHFSLRLRRARPTTSKRCRPSVSER